MITCEVCEKLLADALYDVLESAQQQQLDRHLATCPACHQLLAELQTASRILEESGLTRDCIDYVPEQKPGTLWETIQPSLDQADAERYRQLSRPFPRSHFIPYLTGALAMAASLLVFVFLSGPYTQNANPGLETVQAAPSAAASNAELLNYLRRVETMLMAVANAQARNGKSVALEQTFARILAQEGGVLTNRIENNNSAGHTRLLKDIEFMLMQIANLEDDNMDEGVRLLQDYIEANNILFRIRLIDMRASETII
jgi:hypothetical protein